MIPPQHKDRIGIAHLYGISIAFYQRKPFIVSVRSINDVPFFITYKGFTVNIADRAAFHQFHRITGREAGRSVNKFFQFFMEFYNLVLIGREVERGLPREVGGQYRSGIQRYLPSLIPDISGVDVSIGILIARKRRQFEKLLIRVGTVIGQI